MSTATPFKKIALAGATGSLGGPILQALVAAKFVVTILTREGSTSKPPSLPADAQVTTTSVDYSSHASLTAALAGHDVLVSTLASAAVGSQTPLFESAVAAGVRRIIPSEFGSDTLNPKTRAFPGFKPKVSVQEFLKQKAAEGPVTYTFIMNGAFFDWGLQMGTVINPKERKAELYDGGDRPFSTTSLSTIAQAVVGVLLHPAETANRAVYVHDAVVTQNQLIRAAEKAGSGPFTTTIVSTAEREAGAWAELKKENPNMTAMFYGFIQRALWGEGYGGDFTGRVDNELLGIKGLNEKEVDELVAKYV